jgi:hypothetical protein
MLPDEQNPFGEYAPESQTTAASSGRQKPPTTEELIDPAKYGIGKPRRIIIRGNVAANPDIKDERE